MRIHETRALIPAIDIWRVVTLMLKRYSNEAMMKRTEPSPPSRNAAASSSAQRADELTRKRA
jgi:hypothetical protein